MNYRIANQILFVSAFLATSAPAFARAGGGSNSGATGIVYLILLPFFLIYSAYVTHRLKQKSKECDVLLSQIGKREAGWDKRTLTDLASERFTTIQEAWTKNDVVAIETLTKGNARTQFLKELGTLNNEGKRNFMDELQIEEVQLINIQNYLDDEQDNFTVRVQATARDYTVDAKGVIVGNTKSGKVKCNSVNDVPALSFTEYWTFEREGPQWVLLEMAEAGDWRKAVDRPMLDEGTSPPKPTPAELGYPEASPQWSPA